MSNTPNHPELIALPGEIVGERVLIRPFRPGDGAAFFEAVDESRERLRLWVMWADRNTCVEDGEAYARRCHASWLLREDLTVSIWDRATGQFIGGAGLHNIRWNVPSMDIGYWVRTSAEGKGYVTEAVALLCRLAFETLHAERVTITCDTRNERSAAVPQRLGFVLEGTLRRHTRGADGGLRDTLLFAMTAEDYGKSVQEKARS